MLIAWCPPILFVTHNGRYAQVMYLIHDQKYPADQKVLDWTARELQFNGEYLQRTGVHWRANYGETGPRPPPVLHMWSAEDVGQTHRVVSKNGFW